jgi:FolB domain-containing protein
MSKISIVDLEVFYRVGVPDAERAQPQRLLLTVEMESDFSPAAKTDSITDTIDYFAVTQRLLKFGDGKSWKLIEKLAADICRNDFVRVQAAKRHGRGEKISDSAGAARFGCVQEIVGAV